MNYTLSFIIYMGSSAVIIARLFSHKSRFIYHFKIAHYQKGLSSNRRSIKKL